MEWLRAVCEYRGSGCETRGLISNDLMNRLIREFDLGDYAVLGNTGPDR